MLTLYWHYATSRKRCRSINLHEIKGKDPCFLHTSCCQLILDIIKPCLCAFVTGTFGNQFIMKGDENHISNGIGRNQDTSRKGSRFFGIYFTMYMLLLVAGIVVSVVCEPEFYQDNDYDGISAVILCFFLSTALGAGLGIIPAILLETKNRNGYVYLCVLGFFVFNILSVALSQWAIGILIWLPVAYFFPFILMLDIFHIQAPILEGGVFWANFLYLAVFPTVYYLLLVWISLRTSEKVVSLRKIKIRKKGH